MKIVFVVLYRYAVTLLNTTYSLLILDYFLAGPVPEAVGSGNCSSRQFSNKKYPAWISLRYLLAIKATYTCVCPIFFNLRFGVPCPVVQIF
jgi:hypothetical protein